MSLLAASCWHGNAAFYCIRYIRCCTFFWVASLCKEMHLQGKANGRKVVGLGKVRNLQGTENAEKNKIESARKGNCKELNLEGNGSCKELNLQGLEFASKGRA